MEEIVATCELTAGGEKSTIELVDGDGLLVFYFEKDKPFPQVSMIGVATAEGFVEAALVALKAVSHNAHTEMDNGTQE